MRSGKTSAAAKSDPEIQSELSSASMLGEPDCPHCGGLGYLRRDLPVGHPEFGKLIICTCRNRQINQQVRQRLFSLSHLDELSHLTFENFESRGRVGLWPQQAASLELAFNQARLYAQGLNGWLLLQGSYGCGKTHLVAAIANFAISMGVPTLFVTVPDLLDLLRFTYQDEGVTFEHRFDEIRQAGLLILDDFGTQNATSWAKEKLFQIVNYRYINKLPLVVTTNLYMQDIEERIRSRLEDPELVTKVSILASDYRNPKGDIGEHRLSSLLAMDRCTFATFDLRRDESLPQERVKSLEEAFNTARDFAENTAGWLAFTGPFGCGKTHLAAAIANYRRDKGYPQLFIVVSELLDHLRATFNPNSLVTLDARFEEVKNSPVLILDDLSTQAMTPWVREKLYQLINFRYYTERPTVITTSEFLDQMDARILSRIGDNRLCTISSITVPSYSGAKKVSTRGRRKKI
jgi:DNA replication protein DnaC